MYLSLPTRNHPLLSHFQDQLDTSKVVRVEHIVGVANKIADKNWVLAPHENSHAKVWSHSFKDSVKLQDIQLKSEDHELVLKDNNHILISKSTQDTQINKDDIPKLLLEMEEESKLGLSYIINGLTKQELYCEVSGDSGEQPSESAAQKVVKEYFNKHFRGKQLHQVPKYLPGTGNWSDTETVEIKIKDLAH